mmetsp:Transcript_22092/g.54079  ORF Transcript_22092/g.54079 Transcript_22092/m.54079 type:complete len:506 (+) Transcript_22092:269-1786(+)
MENEEICNIPVFRPDWNTFKNFSEFIKSIESKGKIFGICKVIPPKEFVAREAGYHFDNLGFVGEKPRVDPQKLKETKGSDPAIIYSPIRQHLNGSRGVYEVISIEDAEYMTVEGFKQESAKMMKKASRREQQNFEEKNFRELERSYWSNLSTRAPPLYGADSPGSLFDEKQESWNCSKLGTILDLVKSDLPGVTLPMLYFGMWKAMFAWHVEDMNLFSINYLHFGKPKQWYSIPCSHYDQAERIFKSLYPHQARQCPEFLRHKKCVVSPRILKRHNIPVYRCIQEEGEFIITFPRAFHAGFNYGFNCAESVNFAFKSWVEEGCKAKVCTCVEESVKIDMLDFVKRMASSKVIEANDPLFRVAERSQRSGAGRGRWGKVKPWSCPRCTIVNKRAIKKCGMCDYRPTKEEMKRAVEEAQRLADAEANLDASGKTVPEVATRESEASSKTISPDKVRKRKLDGEGNYISSSKKQTISKSPQSTRQELTEVTCPGLKLQSKLRRNKLAF